MTPVIIIAVAIVVLVAVAAAFVTRRQGGRSGAPQLRSVAPPVEPVERDGPVAAPAATSPAVPPDVDVVAAAEAILADAAPAPPGTRPTLRERLGRTREAFGDRLAEIRLRRAIDDETWGDLEEALILADVGVEPSRSLLAGARVRCKAEGATTSDQVVAALHAEMAQRLSGRDRTLHHRPEGTTVWLVTGVNGSGKTTTIGKLAGEAAARGEKVVLAAADTFRAAAGDQLGIWAERAGAELVSGQEGSDPGAIVFDAVSFARARDCDLLLIDTAGRLQTKVNLMEELKKIRRVAESAGGTPDEVLLVLDATTGQNGLSQAREFAGAVGVTGVVLTKLDGTAKGGIAFAIEDTFGIPVKLVGVGEGAGDLAPFDADEYVDALFT